MAKKIKLNNNDNDFIGSGKDEIILGKGGNDNLSGAGGNDKVNGGEGNDVLKGGSGADKLIGGAGDDILLGGADDDVLNGGAGNNTVDGGEGDDTVVIGGNKADATISRDGDTWTITTANGTTTVTGVELFRFADGTVLEGDLEPTEPEPGETLTLEVGVDDLEGTDGNDTFRAVLTDSLETIDILNGGAGDDLLTIDADGLDNGAAPVITGIETITDADGGGLDLTQVDDVTRINSAAAAGTYTNGSLSTVFAGTHSAANSTVNVDYDAVLTGTADTAMVATALTDDWVVDFDFGADAGALEAVSIDVAAITGGLDTTIELDTDLAVLKTVTVTGAGDAIVYSNGTAYISEATFTTFDASAATGDITTGLNGQVDVTVTFGTGDDTLLAAGSEQGLTVTVGAGADTLDFADLTNIADADEADFAADIISVTDFSVANDLLDLSTGTITELVLTNPQQATVEGAATLFAAVTAAAGLAAADEAVIFDYNGNTYIYVEDAAAGFTAGDGLLELVGVSSDDLDAGNFAI